MTIDRQPRTKNGQPAHSTTGVASSELQPVQERPADHVVEPEEMAAHLEHDDRHRQRQADPEPARHVDEFGVRPGLGGRHHRLERHAADRARARPDLPDLRVHRAGVDRAFRNRPARRPALGRREIALRVGEELVAASGRAEIVRPRRHARHGASRCAGSTLMPQTGSFTFCAAGGVSACELQQACAPASCSWPAWS